MINRLLPSIKIPYELSKGSASQRAQKAEQFTDKLYHRTLKSVSDGGISLNKIRNIIYKMVPPNIKIFVAENSDNFSNAANDFLFNGNNDIYAMTLELRTKNGIFPQEHLVDIFHEGRHIADGLFNPKYYSRFQKMEKNGLLNSKYFKLYDDELYIRECMEYKSDKKIVMKLLERKIHKVLKGHSITDKIDILQNLRYNLESEKNAFASQLKYAKKLEDKGIIMTDDRGTDFSEEFIFEDKINLIKRMAFEIIQKERTTHAAKLSKAHVKSKSVKNKKSLSMSA